MLGGAGAATAIAQRLREGDRAFVLGTVEGNDGDRKAAPRVQRATLASAYTMEGKVVRSASVLHTVSLCRREECVEATSLGNEHFQQGIGPGLFRGLVMGPNEALQKTKQSPPLSNDQGGDPASDCGEEDSSVQQACPSGENPQQERVGKDIMVSLPIPRSMFSAGFPPSIWPGSSNATSHAVMSAADFSLPKSAARREAPVYRPYIPPYLFSSTLS